MAKVEKHPRRPEAPVRTASPRLVPLKRKKKKKTT